MDLIAQYTDDSHSKEDSDASSMDMGPVRLPDISAAPMVRPSWSMRTRYYDFVLVKKIET